ncbi:efflux RND transporter periplasmic adaptor subunit [Phenylobacterium zucineum]|uniref:efflux RND transporter periplasmic adaptor subunit n=1 Tax=Phenylobacterium zucineum TaxID=284016 RepID=UPI0002EB67E1|nr:efflux RND transporter periplasmic adaptor subunit [Phenylobacterium zucineum]
MRTFRTLALTALASLALVGCGRKEGPPVAAAPAVSVATPLKATVRDWDDFTGRFEASHRVDVRARAGGYLQAVHFQEGQTVRKGQLLFTLDPRPAQAQLAAARAQADLARAELKRAESLLAATAISQEEYENRRSAAAVAEATLRARQLDVEFTRVTAPISGRISARRVDPGNLIAGGTSAGDVLTTIVAADPIHFIFDASEAQLLKLQRQTAGKGGVPVQVRLQDEADYRWTGTVDFLDNAVDPASGTIRLRARIRNPDGFLKEGMYGSARMAGAGAYEALLIPETAVASDGPRKVAYVVAADGQAQSRALQLGPVVDGLRVIRAGLNPTDRVVVNGVQRVRPGQKVQPKTVTISRTAQAAERPAPAAAPASTATIVR